MKKFCMSIIVVVVISATAFVSCSGEGSRGVKPPPVTPPRTAGGSQPDTAVFRTGGDTIIRLSQQGATQTKSRD